MLGTNDTRTASKWQACEVRTPIRGYVIGHQTNDLYLSRRDDLGRPRPRLAAAMWVVVALVAALSSNAKPVLARAKAPTIKAVGGLRGWFEPGDHVVIRATVSTDELVDGRVEVSSQTSTYTVSRTLQVAAGTEKEVRLVVPSPAQEAASVDVRLMKGGQELAKTTVKFSTSDTVELVGVMPGLAARAGKVPKTTQLLNGLGRAEIDELSDESFGMGASALEVYDTIMAVGGDLQSLDSVGQASLFGWINHGGRLLLDDDAGLSLLPQQWRPLGTYALAGRGEIRVVKGLASAGKFAEIIEPSASNNVSEAGVFFGAEGFGNVQNDLAARAGVRLPTLTPILLALVGYVILVGPLSYAVLRRRRRLASAWVVIPVMALLTGAAVLVTASRWRDNGHPAAVAFVDGYPGGSESQVTMLAFNRSGGTSRITMPQGWQLDESQGGLDNFEVRHQFSAANDGGLFQSRLEPGQVTTGEFVGPSGDVGLDVQALASGKKISGKVTNNSGSRLADVAVFSSGDAELIGPLDSGQSKTFALDAQPLPAGFSLVDRVWSRPEQGIGNGKPSDLAEFGVWAAASTRTSLYPIGMVRAAGWTDDRPIETNAGALTPTRTVVTQTAIVLQGEGSLSAGAVRTVQVRAPFNQFGGGNGDSAIRYLLPPDLPEQTLVVDAAFGMKSLEFWDGKTWLKVPLQNRLAVVPATAIRAGAVLTRIRPDANFSFDPNQVLLLRGATTKDKI